LKVNINLNLLAVLISIYGDITGVEEWCRRLDVHLPYGCGNQGKNDPSVVTILTFDINDIPQQDFLLHVCATVGVKQAQAKLGWKTCNNKKKAAYQCLATTNDVNHTFDIYRKMLDNKRREKPVYMEIVNLISVLSVYTMTCMQSHLVYHRRSPRKLRSLPRKP
jgi:hypothetical protein